MFDFPFSDLNPAFLSESQAKDVSQLNSVKLETLLQSSVSTLTSSSAQSAASLQSLEAIGNQFFYDFDF